MGWEMPPAELEGRLSAHRKAIQWLLIWAAQQGADMDEMLEHLNDAFPPLDHQEDPGAVPTEAFGEYSAAAAEARLLLEPVKARQRADAAAHK